MTEWSQAVWIAVGLLLSSFVLMVMIYWFHTGRSINNEISRQEANRDLMREYREFNGFNDKTVYVQDIVSLVLQQRGNIGVRILHGTNLYAYWCDDSDMETSLEECDDSWVLTGSAKQTTYTATAVQEKLDVNKVYHGTLSYGLNGEVIGVTFQRGIVDDHGNFTPN